jgi:hypothetical protein
MSVVSDTRLLQQYLVVLDTYFLVKVFESTYSVVWKRTC